MQNNPFQTRIIGDGYEKPDQLLANPMNWRKHPKHQQDALEGMLRTVGWVQRVIVNKRTGHIVDGHLRVEVALRRDEPQVPVLYVDLTEEEERVVLAAIDPIGGLAETDQSILDDLLNGLETGDKDLDAFLDSLRSEQVEVVEGLTDEDEVPEPPVEPVTKLGDIWLLGKHRLMCGDSTSIDAIDRLLDGEDVEAIITDPPYGIGIDGQKGSVAANPKHNRKAHEFRGWDAERPDAGVFNFIAGLGIPAVIWGGNYFADLLPPTRGWIYWDKGQDGLTMSDGELAWTSAATPLRAVKVNRSALQGSVHPTQKPLEVINFSLDYIKAGHLVLDLFGGSGTTMIVCEKTGRASRLMELDPKYCDVIVKRWQDFTGKAATLENDGRTFDELSNSVAAEVE